MNRSWKQRAMENWGIFTLQSKSWKEGTREKERERERERERGRERGEREKREAGLKRREETGVLQSRSPFPPLPQTSLSLSFCLSHIFYFLSFHLSLLPLHFFLPHLSTPERSDDLECRDSEYLQLSASSVRQMSLPALGHETLTQRPGCPRYRLVCLAFLHPGEEYGVVMFLPQRRGGGGVVAVETSGRVVC